MKKNITIIILTILVIGLSGYIAYDKLLSQKDKAEIQENENNDVQENNNAQEENKVTWLDYLLEQEFVSASLSVCTIDGKYVYGKDSDWQPNPGTGRDITKEELKKILNTIYESERENNPYSEIVKAGYAAPGCQEAVYYKYNHNGKEQEFTLAFATTIITEDEDFMKILENHMKEYPYYALNKIDTNYNNLVKDMMKDYIRY